MDKTVKTVLYKLTIYLSALIGGLLSTEIFLPTCYMEIHLSVRALKHEAILYNVAEVFSLSITNPNGRPMLPFDWLIHSSVILASCHRILFLHVPVFCGREKNLKTKIRKKIQTDCEGNIFYLR